MTWPDFFGLQVIHRVGEEPKASPIASLERWNLNNELFDDDGRFLEGQGSICTMIDHARPHEVFGAVEQ
ncbi:hypothetical protein [Haloferula sp.]|uniref:hypothetical protein n=1 Tax=Haloferula sp. TaxID=2497595 RepID=UPI003C76EDBB